jgi:hypothetical protein
MPQFVLSVVRVTGKQNVNRVMWNNAYTSQITCTVKMALAYCTHILILEMVLVFFAVGNPPTVFFVAAVADNSMAGFTMMLFQLFPG